MKDYISPLEIIEILAPKIKKELQQIEPQNREDLEQEIILKILETLKKNKYQKIPNFFEMLEKERLQK